MAVFQRVNTLFLGRAGIRDKFVKEALHSGGLVIEYQGRRMVLPAEEINKLVVGRSEKRILDIKGGEPNYILYFRWQPDKYPEIKQKTLRF